MTTVRASSAGTSPRSHLRRAATLWEVVVAVAVVLILTAAVMPSLIGGLERTRVTNAATTLQAITDAMTRMRRDNQDWPGRLSHLSAPITTADVNVCGNTYAAGRVNNWGGPYIDRVVPATGLNIAIGVIKDSVYRSQVTGNDGLLTMEIVGVSEEDALGLNTTVDNDGDVAGRTTGTVQWTTPDSEGRVTLFFYRPIRGC